MAAGPIRDLTVRPDLAGACFFSMGQCISSG